MSKKYVIEIKPEYEDSFKGLMLLGAKDSNLFVDTLAVENLEELNSDYINEHYGQLQDDAYHRGLEDGKKATFGLVADAFNADYQKGFEDGKAVYDKGCEGCKYEDRTSGQEPCCKCARNDNDYWTAKQTDDKIEVGDEVKHDSGHIFVVTAVDDISVYGIDSNGDFKHSLKCNVHRTRNRYDIQKILEEMKHE